MFDNYLKAQKYNETNFVEIFNKSWKPGEIWPRRGYVVSSTEQYLLHTCHTYNTLDTATTKDLFETFPHANVYKNAKTPNMTGNMRDIMSERKANMNKLGTFSLHGNGVKERYIINMYIQLFPDLPEYANVNDTFGSKVSFYEVALSKIAKIPHIESVAICNKLGCGSNTLTTPNLWKQFYERTAQFARLHPTIKVALYCGSFCENAVKQGLKCGAI